MKRLVAILIGAGGHAASVIDAVRQAGDIQLFGMLDANTDAWGEEFDGVSVLGGDDLLPELPAQGVTHFAITVGSVGFNPIRKKLFEQACECGLTPLTIRHPAAIVSPTATVAQGAQLLAGSIVGVNAEIGENTVINTGAIVEHHCQVAAHAHIASGACLTGHVQAGAESFVGARAVVRQGVSIGAGCTVGMGSVVTGDLPCGVTAYGVPARVVV